MQLFPIISMFRGYTPFSMIVDCCYSCSYTFILLLNSSCLLEHRIINTRINIYIGELSEFGATYIKNRAVFVLDWRWPGATAVTAAIIEQWWTDHDNWWHNYPRKKHTNTHSAMSNNKNRNESLFILTWLLMCKCVNCMQCTMQTHSTDELMYANIFL